MAQSLEIGGRSKQQELAYSRAWRRRQGYAFALIVLTMLLFGWGSIFAFFIGSAHWQLALLIAAVCILPLEACNKWRRDLEDEIARLEGRKITFGRSQNVL